MLLKKQTSDFLIIGGGAIGVAVARALNKTYPDCQVTLLEKEKDISLHTSGRNSGVLHAGFYYSTNSLKAFFCKKGNQMWTQYCEENKLPIRKCGKLVVPKVSQLNFELHYQNEIEVKNMYDLYEQGKINKVELEMIPAEEARKIDPYVQGFGKEFIWSPTTSVVDSKYLVQHMASQLDHIENVQVIKDTKFVSKLTNNRILTNRGALEYKYLINAAGQQALNIAQEYGFGTDLDFFPMKGQYVISDKPLDNKYKTLVYPVPIKGSYVLGVHSTITMNGHIKIGPTVSPAFSIENYHGLENVRASEALNILKNYIKLLFSPERGVVKSYILEEMPKMSIPRLVNDVSMIHKMDLGDFHEFYKPGIRSQLINKKTMKIQNDFILEFGKDMLHILNIVSPGFTCSLPVGEHIAQEIQNHIK